MNTHDDHPHTEAQIDEIAEKAARRALEIVYAEIGQNVLRKLAWLVGVVVVGLALWLAGKNSLPHA
jgi:tetrahydromethanopterin S-methyltransferase subunit G